jgi:hypothetical protein
VATTSTFIHIHNSSLCHAGQGFIAPEPSAVQGTGQTIGCSPLSRHLVAKRVAPFDMISFVLFLALISLLTARSPSLFHFIP